MPNRLIKDSIHESEKISRLSDFQFRVWVNLITYVDDYGRGDARPAIIKGRCFPLRDEIKAEDIGGALQQLAANGCIRLYVVDGMKYLYFPNWDDHQRIRTKVSKFPSPDNPSAADDNPLQSAAACDNSPQNVPLNPNPNPNTESEKESEVVVVGHAREELPDMDSPWEVFVREYENNIGLLPTSEVERGDLEMFFEEFTEDALGEFIRYTARKHPDNPHVYFSSLCRKYLGKNIKTAQQAKAAIMDYDRQKGGRRDGVYRGGAGESPGRLYDGETIV